MSLDINKVAEVQQRLAAEESSKQAALFSSLLIASTSMLGIVVSLHTPSAFPLYIRLAFVAAILLFLLGIASVALLLYSQVAVVRRARAAYTDESISAVRAGRRPGMVKVDYPKYYRLCEKTAYVFLGLGLLSLSSYAILITLSV